MTDAQIAIGIKADDSNGRVIKRTLDDIANSGDRATASADNLNKKLGSLSSAANLLKTTMGGLVAAFGAREIIRMVDDFTLARARIEQATRSTKEFTEAFAGLRRISNETGGSLKDAIDVFQRISFVRDELKATVTDMVNFTGTVQKLGVVSGASTEAMGFGLRQLGQAMSAGIVRAEEWNSVMENMPALAKTIADQFGVTTGKLRLLVVEGMVASADVFNAILNAQADVEAAFEKMPMTIGRSFAQLRNEFQAFLGTQAEVSGSMAAAISLVDAFRLSLFGLGQASDVVIETIARAFAFLVKAIEDAVNASVTGINFLINAANRLPGVDFQTFGRVNLAGGATYAGIVSASEENLAAIRGRTAPKTIFDRAFGNTDASRAGARRPISQDYAALAAGLSDSSGKSGKAAREAEQTHKRMLSLIASTRTEEEKLVDKIREMENLRGFARTADEVAGVEKAIARARAELDDFRLQAEIDGPVGKAFKSLASEIDDGFKDAFKSAFTETDGGFKKLMEGMKNTFKNMIAEIAYQAIARPIIVPLIASIGGAMGLSSAASSSIAGGGGMGGMGNILSLGKNFLPKGFGGIANSINSFGANLGFGGYGPGMSSFTSASLSSVLGAAGLGFAGGGMLASLIGGNQMGGSIGGGLGAGIGMIAGGPVGALIGGGLGSVVGGMFGGGKEPRQTISANLVAADGTLSLGRVNNKGVDNTQAANFGNSAISALLSLADAMGASIERSIGLETNVGTVDKKTMFNGKKVSDKAGDINAILQAALSGEGYFTGGNAQLSSIASKSLKKNGDINQVISDIQFAKAILEGDFGLDEVDPIAEAVKVLNEQLAELKKRAQSLGLPTEALTLAFEEQKKTVIDSIKAQQSGFNSLKDLAQSFTDFLNAQALGSSSSLSPLEKLTLAQSKFGDTLIKARGGDFEAVGQITATASTLLDVARSVYASSVSFAGIESFVRDSIGSLGRDLGLPGYASGVGSASSGLAFVGERGAEIVRFGGGERVHSAGDTAGIMATSGNVAFDIVKTNARLTGMVAELTEESRAMKKEMMLLRKSFERIGNQMAVA